MQGNLADVFGVEISHIFPARPTSKCPEHVPEAATRAFIEGADNLADGRYTSAVAMFRRVIDVGTKALNTDVTAWQLHRRIDKFADEGLLTSDMRDWAHKIRLDGNDALHEFEEPEKEAAEELKLFTEMMLTYMFTLPAKVKASMQRSEG